jgi:Acetyltransferase (GNAT) domain
VAYYGVLPCFIQFGNEVILAAQSADTMTHPRHRYKGMFIELSNKTFDLCHQLGIRLIFGFPNQNSYPAMVNRLGWIETEKMSRFTIPVNTTWGRSFFQNKKKYQERILNNLVLPQKGFRNSVIEDGYAGIYRDEAYYQYKIFANTYVIKIGSADVWIKVNNELIIGDIMLKGNKNNDFFDEIKELAKKLNLNKISFQVCSGCRLHDLFASRYKAIPSFPVLFKDFRSGLPLNKIKFTFADIDIF